MQVLVTAPTPLSPQATSGIYFRDYLKLLDRLALTEEFAVYVAQLNLLRLPSLLRQVCLPKAARCMQVLVTAPTLLSPQVCLPKALPGAKLSMTNLWLGGRSMKNGLTRMQVLTTAPISSSGGRSMKNGLHFDNFDNLLHQLRGTKRALLLPPDDTPHLYYASGGTSVRRHVFSLEALEVGRAAFANETVHAQV